MFFKINLLLFLLIDYFVNTFKIFRTSIRYFGKEMEANIFLGILAFIGFSLAIGKQAVDKERADS